MDITAMRCLVAVIEEGGFSAAARRLRMSKSMCSKHVSDLEAELGVLLLTRSTRSVTPTAVGSDYVQRIKAILSDIEDAGAAVRQHGDTPQGRLKIGAPVSYTRAVLQPVLTRFMREHPSVLLELVLEDARQNLIEGGFDAAVRIGALEDSGLFARRIGGSRVHVVAAPDYLSRHGRPETPADLLQHRALHYSNLRSSRSWPFARDGEVFHQRIEPAFCSNNGDMIRAAAVEGLGLAIMPEFMILDELAGGALVPVLEPYSLPELPVHLVYPSRKHMTAALRAFMAAFQAENRRDRPPLRAA